MAVNWNAPGPQNNALSYFQLGAQMGDRLRVRKEQREDRQREQEGRNALAAYATNPNDEGFAAAVQYDPRSAFAVRADVRQNQADERTQTQQRMKQVSRLFQGVTPENYGQRVSIASEMGLDVSGVPPQYDPAWVERQGQIYSFLAEKPEALSTAGKQAMDMGYQPGTPQFNEVVQKIIEEGLAQPYLDEEGKTRLHIPRLGRQSPAAGGIPPEAIAALQRGEGTAEQFDEMFGAGAAAQAMGGRSGGQILSGASQSQVISRADAARVRQSLGPNGQAAFEQWLRDNNIVVGTQ